MTLQWQPLSTPTGIELRIDESERVSGVWSYLEYAVAFNGKESLFQILLDGKDMGYYFTANPNDQNRIKDQFKSFVFRYATY